MNKEELVDLLVKSQEAILERVDSKLQDHKRSIPKTKKTAYVKWEKAGNEKQFEFNESV